MDFESSKLMGERLKEKQRQAIQQANKRNEIMQKNSSSSTLDGIVTNGKMFAQSLLKNLKEYVVIVKSGQENHNQQIMEKEITELSKQFCQYTTIQQHAMDFAQSIKQLLITGRSVKQNPNDLPNISIKISEDLKFCVEKIKIVLDPRQAMVKSNSTSNLPSIGNNLNSSLNNSSLNNMSPIIQSKLHNSSNNVNSQSTGNISYKHSPLTPQKSPTNPNKNPSRVNKSSVGVLLPEPRSRISKNVQQTDVIMERISNNIDVQEEEISEIPKYPSIEDLINEQENFAPNDLVPWVIKYLITRCEENGALDTKGIFNPKNQLSEYKLQKIYEFNLGDGFVKERDPFVPSSLLRRFFWHLPEPFFIDRPKCLEMAKTNDHDGIASYYDTFPPFRCGVLASVIVLLKKINDNHLKTMMNLGLLAQAFAGCMFKSSSNYNAIEYKLKIPPSVEDETKFLLKTMQLIEPEFLFERAREEMEKITKLRKRKPKPTLNEIETKKIETKRLEYKNWQTDMYMEDNTWLFPKCNRCNTFASLHHDVECSKCGESLFNINNDKVTPSVKMNRGYYFELGNSAISKLTETEKLRIEENETNFLWYKNYFSSKDHLVYFCEDKSAPGKFRVVVFEVDPESENSKFNIPQRVLVLSEEKGYTRHVIECPTKNNERKKAMNTQIDLLKNSFFYLLEKEKLEKFSKEFADFESKSVVRGYKFGILYQKEGQLEENDMYSNFQNESSAYNEFLNWIGKRVVLANHKGFRGGLDCKGENTTGVESIYTTLSFDESGDLLEESSESAPYTAEIMFHVATLLPYTAENPQQLHKKRHLGNDLIIIVFKESGQPFDPSCLASHFNYVFIVISPVRKDNVTHYSISISTKSGVKPVRPFLKFPQVFKKDEQLRKWILLKCVNSERGAFYSKDFSLKFSRTREKIIENYIKTYVPPNERLKK